MGDATEFVLVDSDTGPAGDGPAGLSMTAVFGSPVGQVGLSVLAVSLFAALQYRHWRIKARHGDLNEPSSSLEYGSGSAGAVGTDATSSALLANLATSQSDKKKRSKDRRKRGKDPVKELFKNGQPSKPNPQPRVSHASSTVPRASPSSYNQASSSHMSPTTSVSILPTGHRPYSPSIDSAPSTLGDELSSTLDPSEQHPDGLLYDEDSADEAGDDIIDTPVAPAPVSLEGTSTRRRRLLQPPLHHPPPALASLRLPRLPLRPSKLTVRALNAYADGPRLAAMEHPSSSLVPSASSPYQRPSRLIAESISSRTIVPSTHSPRRSSNATVSVSTMSATSTTSSSASSSQLSPTTPPAHLPISTSHVPKSGREDDEDVHVNGEGSDWGSADAEQPLYVNAADVDDALGNMDPRVGQRDNPRHAHSDRHLVPGRGSSAQQRQRQDGQLGSSVSAPSTLGATSTAASVFTRPDSPKRNGALRASASASAETELSVWDNSLDWNNGHDQQAVADSSSTSRAPVREAFPTNYPYSPSYSPFPPSSNIASQPHHQHASSPYLLPHPSLAGSSLQYEPMWKTPGPPTEVPSIASRAEERNRRSSAIYTTPTNLTVSTTLGANPRRGVPDVGLADSEQGEDTPQAEKKDDPVQKEEHEHEQAAAVLDILFPSLNDPPPSPYIPSPNPEETVNGLKMALEEAKGREERWRAECTRLFTEYERMRWAWGAELARLSQMGGPPMLSPNPSANGSEIYQQRPVQIAALQQQQQGSVANAGPTSTTTSSTVTPAAVGSEAAPSQSSTPAGISPAPGPHPAEGQLQSPTPIVAYPFPLSPPNSGGGGPGGAFPLGMNLGMMNMNMNMQMNAAPMPMPMPMPMSAMMMGGRNMNLPMGVPLPSPVNGMVPMMFPVPVRPGPGPAGVYSPPSASSFLPAGAPGSGGSGGVSGGVGVGPGGIGMGQPPNGGPGHPVSRPPSAASGSSRHGSYSRGSRPNSGGGGGRSRSRAPSPFINGGANGDSGGIGPMNGNGNAGGGGRRSPKKQPTNPGPLTPMTTGTPPSSLRGLPPAMLTNLRTASSGGTGASTAAGNPSRFPGSLPLTSSPPVNEPIEEVDVAAAIGLPLSRSTSISGESLSAGSAAASMTDIAEAADEDADPEEQQPIPVPDVFVQGDVETSSASTDNPSVLDLDDDEDDDIPNDLASSILRNPPLATSRSPSRPPSHTYPHASPSSAGGMNMLSPLAMPHPLQLPMLSPSPLSSPYGPGYDALNQLPTLRRSYSTSSSSGGTPVPGMGRAAVASFILQQPPLATSTEMSASSSNGTSTADEPLAFIGKGRAKPSVQNMTTGSNEIPMSANDGDTDGETPTP